MKNAIHEMVPSIKLSPLTDQACDWLEEGALKVDIAQNLNPDEIEVAAVIALRVAAGEFVKRLSALTSEERNGDPNTIDMVLQFVGTVTCL